MIHPKADYFGPALNIVKFTDRVVLTVAKSFQDYVIWIDLLPVAAVGKTNALKWFEQWKLKVETGEYDESDLAKRQREYARNQSELAVRKAAEVGGSGNRRRDFRTEASQRPIVADDAQARTIAILLGCL